MTVRKTPRRVLFLCTGNSARSIMAEALLTHLSAGRFAAHSAGSHAAGTVHPLALETLRENGVEAPDAASKSWDVFAAAPAMDLVITVCAMAARETCPVWPGSPLTRHWDFADPAAVAGSEVERRAAFAHAFEDIRRAVARLASLAVERMDDLEFANAVGRIVP